MADEVLSEILEFLEQLLQFDAFQRRVDGERIGPRGIARIQFQDTTHRSGCGGEGHRAHPEDAALHVHRPAYVGGLEFLEHEFVHTRLQGQFDGSGQGELVVLARSIRSFAADECGQVDARRAALGLDDQTLIIEEQIGDEVAQGPAQDQLVAL